MALTNSSRIPAPISFAPSQYFEGNDGLWSTFIVRVGTPEQSFRVLPSTVASELFVPLLGACKEGFPSNCPSSRGAEMFQGKVNEGFQVGKTSSWHEIGIYGISAREELGYNASGLYGLDNLGLMIANSGGPTLTKQVIGGVVNSRLWLGRLGLDIKPSNFSEFDNPQRSMIQTLKDENHIPSLSYGYTAGAYYKKPNVYGSLTFGGYDQNRFQPNDITFPFDANDSRKPSLNVQAIVTRDMNNQTVSLLPDGAVYSLIDFAEPHIWLPVSACDAFAKAFNLTYDNTTDLYLIDASTRARHLEQNPTVTFGLGQTANPAERINIVIPYSAFDQEAKFPIYNVSTNYFPIRRAYNDTQYTLGRTFFQEAYVKIDYERGNFSVHQALFPTANEQKILPIVSKDSEAKIEKPDILGSPKVRLGKGVIAGASIGGIALFICMLLLIFWFIRRRKATKEQQKMIVEEERIECADQPKLETDGAAFFEKDGRPFAEMEGHVFPELNCAAPESELSSEPELRELDVRITRTDLSTIFELYELGDSERSYEELNVVLPELPEKQYPPPGWI